MTARGRLALPLAVGLLAAACATGSTGPSVMVLPGQGKNFEAFQVDDAVCRQVAAQQSGTTTERASERSAVSAAATGTALGAGAGDPAIGAAVGAGTGSLGGTAVGVNRADAATTTVQLRYDVAYTQCMYAKGNQIPVTRGSIPPPPAGVPPPPPSTR